MAAGAASGTTGTDHGVGCARVGRVPGWSPRPPPTAWSPSASRSPAAHKTILAALHLPEPARYFDFTATTG
jgi:hypothetical protein